VPSDICERERRVPTPTSFLHAMFRASMCAPFRGGLGLSQDEFAGRYRLSLEPFYSCSLSKAYVAAPDAELARRGFE